MNTHSFFMVALIVILQLFASACSSEETTEETDSTKNHIAQDDKDAGKEKDAETTDSGDSADALNDSGTAEDSSPEDTTPGDASEEDSAIEDAADSSEPDTAVDDVADSAEEDTAEDDVDAADEDIADSGEDTGDTGGEDDAETCSEDTGFDYKCVESDPATCPGGICTLGMCIGPKLQEDRWDACGDGKCDKCENCPADCEPLPQMTGVKEYDNDTTITIWVHGFINKSDDSIKQTVYGESRGCGGLLENMALFGVHRPCGDTPAGELAPNQLTEVEYYGAIPASWMTEQDVAEIEAYPYDGVDALNRYALIIAKFIRHKLTVSGATHVNLSCHSMGCLIIRHMVENNLENLSAENLFVRWFTSTGVIGGAQLARLYDNPTVRDGAEAIGLQQNDFVIMNPDFVADKTAVWDHKLLEGNNPYLKDTIMHHIGASDPEIKQAMNVKLLDLNNPDNEPNDGIMYTRDEYFHSQKPTGAFTTPSGEVLSSTHSFLFYDHMNCPDSEAAAVLATATLFHKRKVFIKLAHIELIKDRENHSLLDGENGSPPAEIAAETEVRYNPYIKTTFGKDLLVHDDKIDYRTPLIFTLEQGKSAQPDYLIFEGPVFDEMDSLYLKMNLLEVDWYERFGIAEWVFDAHQELISFTGQIPLEDNTIELENEFAKISLSVKVVAQY